MEKDLTTGNLILTTQKEFTTLILGAEVTGQDWTLECDIMEAITKHISVLGDPNAFRVEDEPDPRFEITSDNHLNAERALYGAIASNGLRGAAARWTGKKRTARKVLKALDIGEWQPGKKPPCPTVRSSVTVEA